jgi:hypothetical protein
MIFPSDFPMSFSQIPAIFRMNSNEEPVYSPELDGTWVVKCGSSAGKLAGECLRVNINICIYI